MSWRRCARVGRLGTILGVVCLVSPTVRADETRAAPSAASRAAAPSEKDVETAGLHFERGVRLFEDGDANLALVEFERSYAAVPDYRTLFNIGQVQIKLGAFADARRSLERYLELGGERVAGARREAVTRNLEGLALRTAHLTVRVSAPPADVKLDGASLGVAPLKELVSSGAHTLTVHKSGFESESVSVALVGGEERVLDIALRPVRVAEMTVAKTSPGPSPLVWVSWGATGLLLAGTVGMTFAWQSAGSDLDSAKGRVTSRSELDDKKATVETRMTLSAALGVATLVAAGASLWLTLRPPPPSPSPAAQRVGQARGPHVSLTPFGVAGAF